MTESLRPLRAAAAWVIVAYVGIMQLLGFVGWGVASLRQGPFQAFAAAHFPSETEALLLAVAVAIAGVVTPAITGARAVAVIAFLQAGLMLLSSVVGISLLLVKFAEDNLYVDDSFYSEPIPIRAMQVIQAPLNAAGLAALSVLAAVFAWRVYVATDPLAREISDLAEQIAELDEAQEDEQARSA